MRGQQHDIDDADGDILPSTAPTTDQTECCPPQTAPTAPRPPHPHPPSDTQGYELQGQYEKHGIFDKVYVTGPDNAGSALIVAYDIFGFWETTLRGSDLLASHLLLTCPTKIYMPDFFRGNPIPKEKDGDKEELARFFRGTAKLDDRLSELLGFAKYLRTEKGFAHVGVLGYCWGGKLAIMSLAEPKVFDYGALVHPAMLVGGDGPKVQVPLALYASADEPKDVIHAITLAMADKKEWLYSEVYTYRTVHHGWAAARANLKDAENLKQYEDVYQRLADFISGRLGPQEKRTE
ncbi:hypothetical protein P7C73_g2559, partial [Tremellales sp. Uapishka_1]